MKFSIATLLLLASFAQARIVDRVAVVVGNRVVKDSDIEKDLRLTAFLNQETPSSSPAARKQSSGRLIDQLLIRQEVETGAYPPGSMAEAQALLNDIKKRYPSDAAYRKALGAAGISEEDLKERLLWQLTALKFIDARFRPAAFVSDDDVQNYFQQHRQQLIASHPSATLESERGEIADTLAGERVNQLLDEWLTRRRRAMKIGYLEEGLQ